jgi:hypothetical protein
VNTLDRGSLRDLADYVHGIYDELDKIAKKQPAAEISDFALGRVNRAIRETRATLQGHDKFAEDLAEFVAAGENPEVRDAVLALREAEQAVRRVLGKLPFDPLEGF